MANAELNVAPRTVLGKNVQKLRRAGHIPANIYGHRIDSTAVLANGMELGQLMRGMGKNEVIRLSVEGESDPRNVVIRTVQRNPLDGKVIHIDFYQVNMTEKMRADVPVVLTGTSDAVVTYGGVLMQMIDVIHVEALPADLPSEFTVDVSVMTQLEQSVHVRDLHLEGGTVDILTDPEIVVARVASPRLATAEEDEAATAAAAATEAGEGAPAEGAPAPENA